MRVKTSALALTALLLWELFPAAALADPAPASSAAPGSPMTEFYPDRARRCHQEGETAVRCSVTAERRLAACVVLDERPPGFGFGDATIALAEARVSVQDPPGANGRLVTLRFHWKLPPGSPVQPLCPVPS